MSDIAAVEAEIVDLLRQEADLKARLVVVGARLKVARRKLELVVKTEDDRRVKQEAASSSSSSDDEDEGPAAGRAAVKSEPGAVQEGDASEAVDGGVVLGGPGGGETRDGGVATVPTPTSEARAGTEEPAVKRRCLPKRPAGYCLRCWYVHHQVPGGPRHTRDGGCFAGPGLA